ncbi:hypothetical protein JHK87_017829 [Glycine soja]|nr:hypothetical protein JHK87_017829 [Glycine soja]
MRPQQEKIYEKNVATMMVGTGIGLTKQSIYHLAGKELDPNINTTRDLVISTTQLFFVFDLLRCDMHRPSQFLSCFPFASALDVMYFSCFLLIISSSFTF